MYNLQEMTANDLTATVPKSNDPYVIIKSDIQPYTVKIKLSEFKKWIISDLKNEIDSISKIANHADSFHQLYGMKQIIERFDY